MSTMRVLNRLVGRCHPKLAHNGLCGVNRASGAITRGFYAGTMEPFHPYPDRKQNWVSAEEAVSVVKSGMRVFMHGAAATPVRLVNALAEYGKKANLKDVEVIHIHTEGPGTYAKPEYAGIFRSNSLFLGANCRQAVADGRGDVTPIFLGEIPHLFRRKILSLDVAMVSVCPPDNHGFCSLGPSVDCTRSALQNAKYIIGLVNKRLPRTFGDGIVHISHFDALVAEDAELPQHEVHILSDDEKQIGKLIAENLVHDGATLQMGIGSIPDAVLAELGNHKDLGVHSEMFSDGVVDLVKTGAITNSKKVLQTGKIVSSFTVGTRKLYDFLDNNPFVVMCDVAWTNSEANICQNPRVTAINSCIEVDLTGQVCSDSIGTRIYSGFGGQIDFIRGAALSQDGLGKPIIALASTTKKGESKILPTIKPGGGVVTSRAHVHYVVTEWGIAFLFGKTLRQRAYHLIQIAHPDHRETLEKAAFERLKTMPVP